MKSFNCLLSYPSLQSVHIMRLLIWILSQHEDQAHALFSRSSQIWDRGIFQLLLGSVIPSDWPRMGNRRCWEGPSSSNTEPVLEFRLNHLPFLELFSKLLRRGTLAFFNCFLGQLSFETDHTWGVWGRADNLLQFTHFSKTFNVLLWQYLLYHCGQCTHYSRKCSKPIMISNFCLNTIL